MVHARCMLDNQAYTHACTCTRPRAQPHTHVRAHARAHTEKYIILVAFRCNAGFADASQCDVIRTLPLLFLRRWIVWQTLMTTIKLRVQGKGVVAKKKWCNCSINVVIRLHTDESVSHSYRLLARTDDNKYITFKLKFVTYNMVVTFSLWFHILYTVLGREKLECVAMIKWEVGVVKDVKVVKEVWLKYVSCLSLWWFSALWFLRRRTDEMNSQCQ